MFPGAGSFERVLRGFHFQVPPMEHAKLVTCLSGQVMDVIVDLRRGSPSDALAVLVLAREAGLVDESGCRLDVVPLFETISELRDCGDILARMLASKPS